MAFDYDLFYKKPDKLTVEQKNQFAQRVNNLPVPTKPEYATLLTDKGNDYLENNSLVGDNEQLDEAKKQERIFQHIREKERNRIYNERRAKNAVKPRRELLTDDEIAKIFAQENNRMGVKTSPLVPFNGYGETITPDHKRRIQMKHINGIYRNQINELENQRMKLAKELDTLRSKGMIDNAKRAQFEELGKQIEVLNGKMYDGERAFKAFSELEETKENQLKLHNLYKQLSLPNLTDEQKNAIGNQIKELESKVDQRAALDHWLAEQEKEFYEYNSALDKEENEKFEVKDNDRELMEAVNKAIDGLFEYKKLEGEIADTPKESIIKNLKKLAADGKMDKVQLILEQHPDIAKKLGYDPVAQRKFNLRENTKQGINKAAERQEIVNGIKFTPEMREDAVKAKEKYANMTDDDALEETRRAHRGLPPTGKVYKTKAEVKAEKEYRRKQELNAQEQQAKVNASQAALKSKLNNINNLVKARVLKPEQANTLARNAMLEFNASVSAAASKSPRTFTRAPEVTSKGGQRTFTSRGNTNVMSDIVKLRDAETAQKFDSLSDADKAAQFIRMGYDYSQLPQRYRNALDNSDYVNDSLAVDEISREEFDTDKDGVISEAEAKAGNIRVQTTYDESGNPIQVFRNRHTDFSQLGNNAARNFFARDEFNKGDYSRLQKRLFKELGDQYTAEQKQEMAKNIYKQKLESEQRKNTYKTHRNIAEDVLKKAQASYSNDYNVKYTEADIDKIAALIEEAKKQGKTLTQSDIEKFGKALVAKNNEPFQYGRAPSGVSQDVYHRLASTLGSQYVNADENTKLALGQRFAQKTPELDKALELLRDKDKEKKKQGLELLRKLDSDWAKQSKGKDSEIMHPFRDDIYKFETDLLNEELAEMIKVNPARIGKAWNDYLEARKKGESLDKFSERFGGIPIDMPTTRGGRRRSGKWQAARGREKEYNNYIQNILPALQRYDQILKDLENRRIWSEELATKKKF